MNKSGGTIAAPAGVTGLFFRIAICLSLMACVSVAREPIPDDAYSVSPLEEEVQPEEDNAGWLTAPEVEPPLNLDEKFARSAPEPNEDSVDMPRPISPPTAAAKMTIRRDPKSGLQIDTQRRLTPRNPCATDLSARPDELPWINVPNYGQYIFIDHDPLLFEDIPAERYGEVFPVGIQPVVSFVKFMGTVPMLPYKISMNSFAAKDYDAYYAYDHQGNLRPGVVEGAYFPDYYLGSPYPKSRFKAAIVQMGVTAGIVLFLP